MKVHIHLNIDHDKKVLFESLKSIHGKSFSEVLEEGIDRCLSEAVPSKLIEKEISQTKQHLIELEQSLITARMMEEQIKVQKKAEKQGEEIADTYLEEMRNQKFEASKSNIMNQWKRGDMNWPRLVDLYQFKNAAEAREWFSRKIAEVDT